MEAALSSLEKSTANPESDTYCWQADEVDILTNGVARSVLPSHSNCISPVLLCLPAKPTEVARRPVILHNHCSLFRFEDDLHQICPFLPEKNFMMVGNFYYQFLAPIREQRSGDIYSVARLFR